MIPLAQTCSSPGPFGFGDETAYRRWRERKLEQAPQTVAELIVEVGDAENLSAAEHAALLARCRRANMAIYANRKRGAGKDVARIVGRQFGLENLDANWLADEDGVSQITVCGGSARQDFIPYTNRPIKWHTDGYYNPPERQIRAMVLHCARSAAEGGENCLMDHEMAYLLLRDANPDLARALFAPDAMTIPERVDEGGVARAAQTGPVFSIEKNGALHMRYTARTRSIEWKRDEMTLAATSLLEKLLASDSPRIYRARLEPGMGLLCNNVLHDRAGFRDDADHPRLLQRARFYDRIMAPRSQPRAAGLD
ncbi:MAG: TauD/TfdA family dioxygenase [Nitrosomonadales bacterium]|nr:TauD/TfdA family dioxygenase [Nitrosomonadales bacterium]